MTTRLKAGITKPNPRDANLALTNIPSEPKIIKTTLQHLGWNVAIQEEFHALHENSSWDLVEREKNMNIVGYKWVLKTKLKADGSLERLKAWLVAKEYNQVEGIGFSETYSPVIKPGSICLIHSIATMNKWDIRQLDVKNAFLYSYLQELVYMEQLSRFIDSQRPTHVCRLKRALYRLCQAPSAWFDRFSGYLLSLGFYYSPTDSSMFICQTVKEYSFFYCMLMMWSSLETIKSSLIGLSHS